MMNNKDIINRKAKRFSLKTGIVIAIFTFCCLGFIGIADEMVLEKENAFDFWAFNVLKQVTSSNTTLFMEWITFLGSSYFLLPAYVLIVLIYLLKRDWRNSLNIASVGIWSSVVLLFLKAFFKRQRPPDPLITNVAGFSFPSGHSFSSFTFFGLLIFITTQSNFTKGVKWTISVSLFLIAILIAVSRVYLHVHYASDIIAGFLLAAVWLIFSFTALTKVDHALRQTL